MIRALLERLGVRRARPAVVNVTVSLDGRAVARAVGNARGNGGARL